MFAERVTILILIVAKLLQNVLLGHILTLFKKLVFAKRKTFTSLKANVLNVKSTQFGMVFNAIAAQAM